MAKRPSPPHAFYSADTYRPDESAGFLMRQVLNLMQAEVDALLEPTGLTNAQWQPLLKLYWGSATTVAELARECRLDTGAMTRTLDRLEAKGLVRRERSETDRRVVNLALTEQGTAAAREIPAALSRMQNEFLRDFSVDEWQQLKDLLRRLRENGQALQAQRQGTS